MIQAVLFDLDGTLADTAPDLGYALNLMRAARSSRRYRSKLRDPSHRSARADLLASAST